MNPPKPSASRVVVLAGGVGASRFLRGVVPVASPERVTAVVNTGDDCEFYGVHVSPDLDIVTYTLANRVDRSRGYGIEGDSFGLIDQLGALGHETWFRLGDRDFAVCHHRTLQLRAGRGLADVTGEICRALGVTTRILPMSEDPCPTYIDLEGGRRVHFEEYLARDGAPDEVVGVDLAAAGRAAAAPGVVAAIESADLILLSPSNPIVSIGPILAVPEIAAALARRRAPAVAVSPIVGGAPIKGPADRLMRGLGHEVSARGVAELYRGVVDGFVLDQRDAASADDIEALGLRTRVVDTLMRDATIARRLAAAAIELAESLR